MKVVEVDINKNTKPQWLIKELQQQNLQRGDKLKMNASTSISEEFIILICLFVLIIFQKKRVDDYANNILNEVFKNRSVSELEEEIKKEYGIDIEITSKEDEDNWRQFSKKQLTKAYSVDEPDYEINMVKEPNPQYKK